MKPKQLLIVACTVFLSIMGGMGFILVKTIGERNSLKQNNATLLLQTNQLNEDLKETQESLKKLQDEINAKPKLVVKILNSSLMPTENFKVYDDQRNRLYRADILVRVTNEGKSAAVITEEDTQSRVGLLVENDNYRDWGSSDRDLRPRTFAPGDSAKITLRFYLPPSTKIAYLQFFDERVKVTF